MTFKLVVTLNLQDAETVLPNQLIYMIDAADPDSAARIVRTSIAMLEFDHELVSIDVFGDPGIPYTGNEVQQPDGHIAKYGAQNPYVGISVPDDVLQKIQDENTAKYHPFGSNMPHKFQELGVPSEDPAAGGGVIVHVEWPEDVRPSSDFICGRHDRFVLVGPGIPSIHKPGPDLPEVGPMCIMTMRGPINCVVPKALEGQQVQFCGAHVRAKDGSVLGGQPIPILDRVK